MIKRFILSMLLSSTLLNVLADSDQKNFLNSFYELNKEYATNHSSVEQSYALLKEQFPNENIVDFLYVVSLKQLPLFGIIPSYTNKSGSAYFLEKLEICNKELIEEIPFSNVFNCYPEFKGFRLSSNFDSLLDHHYLEAATFAPLTKTYKDTPWQKINQEYKEYLDKKPRDLKAYIFFWKQLLESEKNTDSVVQSLSKYVEENIGHLKSVCESDRESYDKTKNCLLYNINRPLKEIYHRTILNLPYEESVKHLKKLIDIASYDGRYYRYNLLLARLYETKSFKRNYRKLNKKNNAALLQYELAFKGYKELLENEIIRMKYYGYSISAYYEAGNMAVDFDTFGGYRKLPPHWKYDDGVLKTFKRVWKIQFEELTSGIKHNGGNVSFNFNNFFAGLEKKYALLPGPNFKEIYQIKMKKVEDVNRINNQNYADTIRNSTDNDVLKAFLNEKYNRGIQHAAIKKLGVTAEGQKILLSQSKKKGYKELKVVLEAIAGGPDKTLKNIARTAAEQSEDLDAFEAALRAMDKEEVVDFCRKELEQLSRNPDKSKEKVLLLLRGIRNQKNGDVALLRKIMRESKDEKVKNSCVESLTNLVLGQKGQREDIFKVLGNVVPTSLTRRQKEKLIKALSESSNLKLVLSLDKFFVDEYVQIKAREAICKKLMWHSFLDKKKKFKISEINNFDKNFIELKDILDKAPKAN